AVFAYRIATGSYCSAHANSPAPLPDRRHGLALYTMPSFTPTMPNALSLSAVFGILVLIFQHGNLQGLLSYRSTGALDATQPILLFATSFGIATDYAVFLLSRIKAAYYTGIANDRAVAICLERTA